MTYYELYLKTSEALINGRYPIVISEDKSFLIKHSNENCGIEEIYALPTQDKICAKGHWQILEEETFAFNNENPYNLETISHEDLSKLLSSP